MFYGPGAGGAPTASAVLGDLVAASRNVVHGGRAPGDNPYANLPIANFGDVETRYLVSMLVRDEKGTLSQIAKVFSEHGVSISTVQQDDYRVIGDDAEGKDFARLMVVTHRAKESDLAATVEALETSHIVASVASVLRMEGLEGI